MIVTPDINQLSTLLLDQNTGQKEVERILQQVHDYFHKVTDISGNDLVIKHLAAVPTASGMALSLNHAAQCLLDYKRTLGLLRGTVQAIHDRQQKHPGETIHLFYAGCGPYAPFVTLVAPLFTPGEILFTVLEVNEESLESAQKLITTLGLTDYILEYCRADAVTYKFPNPGSIHILFSETLDALLYREAYVPILWNMLPQLPEDITLIPENVLVNLTWEMNGENELREVDNLIDVRETFAQRKENTLPARFPAKEFPLDAGYKGLALNTEVHIYREHWLRRGESSLTLPYEMSFEQPMPYRRVAFTYHLTPQVELKYEFQ